MFRLKYQSEYKKNYIYQVILFYSLGIKLHLKMGCPHNILECSMYVYDMAYMAECCLRKRNGEICI